HRLGQRLNIDPQALGAAILPLVALHDIGKLSRAFQAKRPDLWPSCLGPAEPKPADQRHDDLSFLLLCRDENDGVGDLLMPLFPGWLSSERNRVLAAVAGHHGEPPTSNPGGNSDHLNTTLGRDAHYAVRALTHKILELFKPAPLSELDESKIAV